MKVTTTRVSAVLALLFLMAVLAFGAKQATVKRTVLQQGDLSIPGREAVMVRADIPAGGSTGRHTHPGEEISYVMEGTLRLEVDGQPPRMLKAGDVLMIPAGKIHNASSGPGGASVIATYVVEKGKPLASPVP